MQFGVEAYMVISGMAAQMAEQKRVAIRGGASIPRVIALLCTRSKYSPVATQMTAAVAMVNTQPPAKTTPKQTMPISPPRLPDSWAVLEVSAMAHCWLVAPASHYKTPIMNSSRIKIGKMRFESFTSSWKDSPSSVGASSIRRDSPSSSIGASTMRTTSLVSSRLVASVTEVSLIDLSFRGKVLRVAKSVLGKWFLEHPRTLDWVPENEIPCVDGKACSLCCGLELLVDGIPQVRKWLGRAAVFSPGAAAAAPGPPYMAAAIGTTAMLDTILEARSIQHSSLPSSHLLDPKIILSDHSFSWKDPYNTVKDHTNLQFRDPSPNLKRNKNKQGRFKYSLRICILYWTGHTTSFFTMTCSFKRARG